VSDEICDKCGLPMLIKKGKFGPFLGCSGYPGCKNIVKTGRDASGNTTPPAPELTDTLCDKCGRPMVIKRGRFGPFLGCSGYPECKNIMKVKSGR
jgi:DNA topoisomerase-1